MENWKETLASRTKDARKWKDAEQRYLITALQDRPDLAHEQVAILLAPSLNRTPTGILNKIKTMLIALKDFGYIDGIERAVNREWARVRNLYQEEWWKKYKQDYWSIKDLDFVWDFVKDYPEAPQYICAEYLFPILLEKGRPRTFSSIGARVAKLRRRRVEQEEPAIIDVKAILSSVPPPSGSEPDSKPTDISVTIIKLEEENKFLHEKVRDLGETIDAQIEVLERIKRGSRYFVSLCEEWTKSKPRGLFPEGFGEEPEGFEEEEG